MSNSTTLVVDDDDVELMITRAALWLDDDHLSEATQEIFQDLMTEAAGERFSTESNNGEPWVPLSLATLRIRMAKGYGRGPINVRTGKMRSFLTRSKAVGGPSGGGVEFSWPESASGELYMKMQRARGFDSRTPARPVIDADQSHADEFVDRALANFEGFMK